MRWEKEKHKENDIRIKNKFLIFPRTLNGETRWWERADIVQQYLPYYHEHGKEYFWVSISWLENYTMDKLTE